VYLPFIPLFWTWQVQPVIILEFWCNQLFSNFSTNLSSGKKKPHEELQDSGFFLEFMTLWKLFCVWLDFAYCLSADAWILWQHISCLVSECVPGCEWDCHLICQGMFVTHNKFLGLHQIFTWLCGYAWTLRIHNWCHSTF